MIISDFTVEKDGDNIKPYPGMHAISWAPKNDTPFVEGTIMRDGKIVGSILRSPGIEK